MRCHKIVEKWPLNVIMSRRCKVNPLTLIWWNAHESCPCHHKIWEIRPQCCTVHEKPPKLTLLCNNVTTSLRHEVYFYMIRCSYAIPMFSPNLQQIGRKTSSQNRQKTYFRARPLPANIKIQKFGGRGGGGGWSSSNVRCFIIHPGGGSPTFEGHCQRAVVGFEVGVPCQGVNGLFRPKMDVFIIRNACFRW